MILHYLFRRICLLCFIFVALTLLAFSLNYLFPGDMLLNISGQRHISEEQRLALQQQLALDQSYWHQYVAYIQRILQGDFGLSLSTQQPIFTELKVLLPATLELVCYALLFSLIIGIPLGLFAAIQNERWPDKLISAAALIGYSVPVFWWALLLIMLFSLQLGWLPTSGRIGVLYEIPEKTGFILIDIMLAKVPYQQSALYDALRHIALPTIVLATYPTTVMCRFVRDSMLNVLAQNYIKTARAKGLSRTQVLYRHGLRNALLPVTQQLGLQFASLLTLAMMTESIFSWPGIGQWLIESIYQRNYPAIQAGLLILSTIVISANVLTDLLHTLFNPLARKNS